MTKAAPGRLLLLALQACCPPINLPRVLQHINSTREAFNFIHALAQSILAFGQILQTSMITRASLLVRHEGPFTCRNANISRSSRSKHSMGRNNRCSCSRNFSRRLEY